MSDIINKNIDFLLFTSTYTIPNGGGDVTGFSLPILANTDYQFEFEIIAQSSATNKGFAFGVNGPASPNYVLVHTEIPTSLTAVTQGMQRAYATGTSTATSDSITANILCRCYGRVSNGANAGNLILWASKNSNGGTMNVMPNSIMKMWRINPSN
jgi:hypothetical protein